MIIEVFLFIYAQNILRSDYLTLDSAATACYVNRRQSRLLDESCGFLTPKSCGLGSQVFPRNKLVLNRK